MELFEYVGRKTDQGLSLCGQASCEGCELCEERGHRQRTRNWLIFKSIWTQGALGFGGDCVRAPEGGVRDVIWAWGRENDVYRDDGTKDDAMICLPPNMCYGFRKAGEPCDGCDTRYCIDDGDLVRCVGCGDLLCNVCRDPCTIHNAPASQIHNLDGKGNFECPDRD